MGAGARKAGPLRTPGPGRSRVPDSHDETAISLAWRRPPGGFRDKGNQDQPCSLVRTGCSETRLSAHAFHLIFMIPDNHAADTAELCLFVCFLSFSWKKWFMYFFSLKANMTKPVVPVRVKTRKPSFPSPGSRGFGGSWLTDISCGWRGVRAVIGLGEANGGASQYTDKCRILRTAPLCPLRKKISACCYLKQYLLWVLLGNHACAVTVW